MYPCSFNLPIILRESTAVCHLVRSCIVHRLKTTTKHWWTLRHWKGLNFLEFINIFSIPYFTHQQINRLTEVFDFKHNYVTANDRPWPEIRF